MKQQSLTRRLIAGTVGLMVGLVGAVAFSAAPAQATGGDSHIVVTQPTCEDEYGYIEVPQPSHAFKYQIDGQDAAGTHTVVVGSYEVTKVGKITGRVWWSETVEIVPAEDCEDEDPDEKEKRRKGIKEPEATQPTCDDPGTITIPEVKHLYLLDYKINGEPAERGSVHEVEPGIYVVSAHGKRTGKQFKEWIVEILEPEDCPEDEPEKEPEDEVEPGELPVTGMTTGLIALGALVLLALGGGLFMLARRRRVTFTA